MIALHGSLCVLDETLAYQVDQIKTVLPYDVTYLGIEEGRDLCTLVTCTPFGVNTHRLLVRGTRIPYEEAEEIVEETIPEEKPASTWEQEYLEGLDSLFKEYGNHSSNSMDVLVSFMMDKADEYVAFGQSKSDPTKDVR